MTRPGAAAGICFHAVEDRGRLLDEGFTVQVANGGRGCEREVGFIEQAKTGSLLGARGVYKQLVRDNEWFQIGVTMRGEQVQVRANGMPVVDYAGPQPPEVDGHPEDHGTFALEVARTGECQRASGISASGG